MPNNTKEYSRNSKAKNNYSVIIISVLITLLVGNFLVRTYLYDIFSIPAASMAPTINVGNYVMIKKGPYGKSYIPWRDRTNPERGEIFAFRPPHDDSTIFLKRIIGIPGDIVSFSNKQLTINGIIIETKPLGDLHFSEALNGHHYVVQYYGDHNVFGDFTIHVPDDSYFVMGDNRDNSMDSRAWGSVPTENMIGKLIKIW